jgi:hypothetical protein
MLLQTRFSNTSADEELDSDSGFRTIEKMTWLRWLFFVLGTLPQAIKLMVMSDVPWMKAWGMILLSSFLLVEILVVFSTIIRRADPRDRPANRPCSESTYIIRVLGYADQFLTVIAILPFTGFCFYWVQFTVVRTFGLDAFFFPVERGPGLLGIVIRHIIAVSSALIALISPFFLSNGQLSFWCSL